MIAYFYSSFLLGIFEYMLISRLLLLDLFLCDKELEFNSLECDSGKCCLPKDKVVNQTAISNWNWFFFCFFWPGGYRMFVERPNRTCVNVSSLCKMIFTYCYLKDTPSSSTTMIATSTSGVKESTESRSSSIPETQAVKVSSVGVIVGVSVAVLVLTIFGVFILLAIRIRRKRAQKLITEAASKRAITFSNRRYNMNGEYENSHECLTAICSPTLPSDNVSTDITYSAVEKGTRTIFTEQIPILEFRNYYNYRNVQCTDSNKENAYDSTGLQTNHAVIEDTYDYTVSVVNNHAVIDDTYDHTVNIVNNHDVIDDTYDHTVSVVNNHAVIDDTYDYTVSVVNNHTVTDDTYDHTVSVVHNHAVIDDTYDHTVNIVNNHDVIDDTYDHTVSVVNSHVVIEDTYDHTVSPVNSHVVIEDTYGYEPC
ncbi:hypothetical protein ACJMK2_010255 [Sinanodonta woodiana]|uniref:Uncharacterized protein n=1 Tax=Sinanodonta woodiana TaxID=1069815 RepID=A0ABD3VES1_SINWO